MTTDMFIKLGGAIKGGTKDKKMPGCSDLLGFSWGMTQSGAYHTGGGGGGGKVQIHDLSFTRYVDTATSATMGACASGKPIPEVTLTIRRAGGDPGTPGVNEIIITMTNVIVTSVSSGGAASQERFTEDISLNFQKVTHSYFDQADLGTAGGSSDFTWDISGNSGSAS